MIPFELLLELKLYIAEKPSLGRAIAAALPKPHKKQQGYIEVGNGDIVTWCIGHLLEQADPEAYDPSYAKWQLEHLPIIPQQWQLKAKAKTRSQLSVLRKLVKQAKQLVHAGDPDREGQLLVDEVIDHLKVSTAKKAQTQRLLVSDLNLAAVKKSLSSLRSNQEFAALSISALARSRADWLYGMNLTRAYSILGQKSGFHGVLSVGRVQTPVLALVVNRDREISEFRPHDYFQVDAHLKTDDGQCFSARWQPSDACAPYLDSEGRVINRALAENVITRINNQPALVESVKQQQKKQSAPLPYNLSALQIDAAKQFGLSAKQVLDICQTLYEKYQLITYPRSDCRYLPNDHLQQAPELLSMLSEAKLKFSDLIAKADSHYRSKAWNSKKVGAHHAIIPTLKSPLNIALSNVERNVYQLIARQYVAQFFPLYLSQQTKVDIEIVGGRFSTSANVPEQLGWKLLYQRAENNQKAASDQTTSEKFLPQLAQGQALHCERGQLLQKVTEPPKPFTDASLLAAMTGIARYVVDPELKKILKETDGIGTEATRAGIIDLLFKRGFLVKSGKTINASDLGRGLIQTLPEQARVPDMTARWELALNQISERQLNYQHFMAPLEQSLTELLMLAQSQDFSVLPKKAFKPKRTKKKSTVKSK